MRRPARCKYQSITRCDNKNQMRVARWGSMRKLHVVLGKDPMLRLSRTSTYKINMMPGLRPGLHAETFKCEFHAKDCSRAWPTSPRTVYKCNRGRRFDTNEQPVRKQHGPPRRATVCHAPPATGPRTPRQPQKIRKYLHMLPRSCRAIDETRQYHRRVGRR